MKTIMANELIKEIVSTFGLDEAIAELMVKRGIADVEDARRFLYPSKEDFEDPFTLTGMREATQRIRRAIEEKEKIVVYGDYDCDGICATATLCGYLQSVGADVSYFIPSRFDTGYGLNTEALEEIAETLDENITINNSDDKARCGIIAETIKRRLNTWKLKRNSQAMH